MDYSGFGYIMKFLRPFGYLDESKTEVWTIRIFWIVALAMFWQFGAPQLYSLAPTPVGIYSALVRLYHRGILVDTQVSVIVIMQSAFLIALPIGCLLSYLYSSGLFRDPIYAIAALRNAPPVALIAAFILMRYGG